MKASLLPLALALAVAGLSFTIARSANAADSECPVSEIGQACGGSDVCIAATCCDDPNGCAYDAGSVGSGSGSSGGGSTSSSSGGTTATGVSRSCGLCTFIAEAYCAPADEGKACPSGGICEWLGGGAENVTEPDGGTTQISFDISGCGPNDTGDDGGGFSGSGGSGGGSTSGSSSGTNGGGSGGGVGGSSSSGSSSGSSGSGSSGASSGSSGASSGSSGSAGGSSDGGTGSGTAKASCAIAPRGNPWSALPFVALGLVAIARRRRNAR